ncbi:MAG TPA: MerR family transcriptional regulator [Thermotogota bacterium]|nr:MerR family transcriptional regulator [Thermotogota bacterium]HPJ89160.1 MerR family transcriptional regulator [Thermotogota bacterium]HPR95678.1 MerR family transcriptional regulator [Thermotogota bacterium]
MAIEKKKTIDRDDPFNMPKFIISVASSMLGIHPQTLRQYEKRGFVEPFRLGNLRLYSEHDIEVINHIKELADEGIPTTGIDRIIELETRLERAQKKIKLLERENELLKQKMRKEIPPLPVKIEYKSYEFKFYNEKDIDKKEE